jgi:hypothetical protein
MSNESGFDVYNYFGERIVDTIEKIFNIVAHNFETTFLKRLSRQCKNSKRNYDQCIELFHFTEFEHLTICKGKNI